MKRAYLTKRIVLAALAVCLCVAATVGVSIAYYTDTSNASGSVPFATSPNTEITETFEGMNKDIQIENTGTAPVVVRVKATFPSEDFATYSIGSSSDKWVTLAGDEEWVYYAEPLAPGAQTERLDINVKPADDAPGNFDITVFQQFAYATYEAGNLTAQFGSDPTVTLAPDACTAIGPADKL